MSLHLQCLDTLFNDKKCTYTSLNVIAIIAFNCRDKTLEGLSLTEPPDSGIDHTGLLLNQRARGSVMSITYPETHEGFNAPAKFCLNIAAQCS